MVTLTEIEDMQQSAQATIDGAVTFMAESPWPGPETLSDYVYG